MIKLASQMAALTFGRVVGAACVFAVTLIMARSFGADTVANYSILLSAASILSVLLPMGFHAIATLFSSEYRATGESWKVRSFTRYAHRLTFYNTLLLLPVVVPLAFFAPDNTSYDLVTLALLLLPAAFAMANIYLNSALLMGLEKHYWAHLPDMALRPILLFAGLSMLILFAPMADGRFVLLLLVLSVSITMVVQWRALHRILPEPRGAPRQETELGHEKRRWWHLAPSHMKITLLWDYYFELHMLLAGLLLMPEHVAILFVCFRIRQLAGFGVRSLYSLLMPKVFAANALENKAEAQRMVRLSVRLTATYALIVWVAMIFVGPMVLRVFGEAFQDSQMTLLIMLAVMVLRTIFGPASAVLGMHRHAEAVVKVLVGSLCISLVFTVLGIFVFETLAIPVAYLISTTFSAAALWWIAKRRTGINCAIWS